MPLIGNPAPGAWQAAGFGLAEILPTPKKKSVKEVSETNTIQEVFGISAPERLIPDHSTEFVRLNKLENATSYKYADPKSLVGLEIEVENVMYIDPNIPLAFWKIAEDGSLRNNGREFKTLALPLNSVEPALTQLARGLNPNVDFSVRTSVHVHQDVRGMTLNQLIGMLLTYVSVENLLFKYAGNNRRNSIYCVPLADTDFLTRMDSREKLMNMLRDVGHNWHKYSALNLLPIRTFGTVEYRHMPGTLEVKKLLIWVDLLSRLKLYAYKHDYNSIVETITGLNTNSRYKEYVADVFGDLVLYLDTSNLQMDMEHGVFDVKNATVANKFHEVVTKSPLVAGSQAAVYWKQKTLEEILDPKRLALFKSIRDVYWPTYDMLQLYQQMTASADNKMIFLKTVSPAHRKILKAALTPGDFKVDDEEHIPELDF